MTSANSTPYAVEIKDFGWVSGLEGPFSAEELDSTVFKNAADPPLTFTDFHLYISNTQQKINEPDAFSDFFDVSAVTAGGATQSNFWNVEYYEGGIPAGTYFRADVSGFPEGTTFVVRATPAPGAALLACFGTALVRWLRRRRTL